jgi:ribosomal protein L16 Arg81 hydroxylase
MSYGLNRLLFPIPQERFFGEFYEKGALHITNRPCSTFLDIFSMRAAESLLWQHEAHLMNFLRVHNNGTDLSPPRHIGPLNFANWAFGEYQTGASLVINNLEDYQLPLASLVREIELSIGSRVSASAYITPANARAFQAHFDTHDVIIVQIEGSKRYELYEGASNLELPLERQAHSISSENLLEPSEEIILTAGDTLYIPRGLVHVANTSEQSSLHVSIGLHPLKVLDLIHTAIELAAESNSDLRRSHPFGNVDTGNKSGFEQLVLQIGEVLGAELSLDAVLLRLQQRFVASLRPLPDRQLECEVSANKLTINDELEKAIGSVCSILANEATVQLGFPSLGVLRNDEKMPSVIEGPVMLEPALRFIADHQHSFSLSDLPGGLSDQSKLVLARRLIREGLLRVVKREQSLDPFKMVRETFDTTM